MRIDLCGRLELLGLEIPFQCGLEIPFQCGLEIPFQRGLEIPFQRGVEISFQRGVERAGLGGECVGGGPVVGFLSAPRSAGGYERKTAQQLEFLYAAPVLHIRPHMSHF